MNYLVIDVETGGFNPETNAITQIACVVINGETLEVLSSYESYIFPYDKIYDTAALISTNISIDLLHKKGKDAKLACNEIELLLNKYSSRSHKDKLIWVGQNPLFDIGFINNFFFDFSKNTLEKYFTGKSMGKYFVPDNLDTILLARTTWQRNTMLNGAYKLNCICDKAGVELTDAHDAMNDTIATKDVFVVFVNYLRNNQKQKTNIVDDENVTQQSSLGNRFRTEFEIK